MKTASFASKILALSGWRSTGKTTSCRRLVDAARAAGWDVAGLLSPARVEAERKTGIEVEDLRTDQRRLLASSRPGELNGLVLGPWTFSDQALEWGNQVIAQAMPCDLLVLDELGPLEFERGQGWTAAFPALDSKMYALALVVIRPECLPTFLQRWPQAETADISALNDAERLIKR